MAQYVPLSSQTTGDFSTTPGYDGIAKNKPKLQQNFYSGCTNSEQQKKVEQNTINDLNPTVEEKSALTQAQQTFVKLVVNALNNKKADLGSNNRQSIIDWMKESGLDGLTDFRINAEDDEVEGTLFYDFLVSPNDEKINAGLGLDTTLVLSALNSLLKEANPQSMIPPLGGIGVEDDEKSTGNRVFAEKLIALLNAEGISLTENQRECIFVQIRELYWQDYNQDSFEYDYYHGKLAGTPLYQILVLYKPGGAKVGIGLNDDKGQISLALQHLLYPKCTEQQIQKLFMKPLLLFSQSVTSHIPGKATCFTYERSVEEEIVDFACRQLNKQNYMGAILFLATQWVKRNYGIANKNDIKNITIMIFDIVNNIVSGEFKVGEKGDLTVDPHDNANLSRIIVGGAWYHFTDIFQLFIDPRANSKPPPSADTVYQSYLLFLQKAHLTCINAIKINDTIKLDWSNDFNLTENKALGFDNRTRKLREARFNSELDTIRTNTRGLR